MNDDRDPDPLGLRPDDSMVKYRREVQKREREFAEARRQREQKEQRQREQPAIDQLRAEMQRELAVVHQQFEVHIEAVGQALGEVSDQTVERFDKAIKEVEQRLLVALERRYGEIMGRLDAFLPERARAQPAKDFRFSNEPREVVDNPPAPLLRKVTMN
jgi:hypothetical protein